MGMATDGLSACHTGKPRRAKVDREGQPYYIRGAYGPDIR